MSKTFDDPNREALGLDPIWTDAGDAAPEPEPEPKPAKKAAAKKDEPTEDA